MQMNSDLNGDGIPSMPMVLNLDPGKRADPFVLGADIRDVLNILSSQKWRDVVGRTMIKYDLGVRRDSDILFDLTQNGVLLRFSCHTQKLIAVEIYAFQHVQLSFCGEVFTGGSSGQFIDDFQGGSSSSPQPQMYDSFSFRDSYASRSQIPTFAEIYRLFRPTYPGIYEFRDDLITYTLNYPGISFVFVIPERWRALALEQQRKRDHPIEFPDKSSPQVIRIRLSEPLDENGQPIQLDPEPESADKEESCADVKKQNVEVRFLDGLYFDDGTSIKLGDSAQDVISVLGEPEGQFLKPKEQMKGFGNRSNPIGSSASSEPPQDVFYNYFGCGIDVLFDGRSFTVKKFILHTNYPHHKDFGRYSKSIWRATIPQMAQNRDVNRNINADSTWTEVKAAFSPC